MRRGLTGCLFLALAWLLTGCNGWVDSVQGRVDPAFNRSLIAGHSVGQTFVAHHAGLNRVELWLEPVQAAEGSLVLHLRPDATASTDLVTVSLPLAEVTSPNFYSFIFEPQADSLGRYYYVFWELVGPAGEVRVGAAPGDAYMNGALYADHVPQEAQTAFRLAYAGEALAIDWAGVLAGGLGLLGAAGLLFVVPGWALLAWLWREDPLPWPARMGLAAGISVALYPVLLLWTNLVGLHLGAGYAWGVVLLSVGALIWRYRAWRPRDGWAAFRAWRHSEAFWPDLAFLGGLALVFGVRLLVVRTLDAPMWGDSYHHTMIAQLIVDRGGLFQTWEPYAALQSLTYHFGFHTNVAIFHWLTGIEVVRATLWVGQILNGLAVVTLYLLATRISNNRWVGAAAVVLAGLVCAMPMYYVNWGRYTQMTGQVILPAAVFLTWATLESRGDRKPLLGLASLVIGGMAISHYRILIFYVIFVVAWILARLRWNNYRQVVPWLALIAVGGALIFMPWFLHLYGGKIVANLTTQLSKPPAKLSSFEQGYNDLGSLAFYLPLPWWFAMAFAAGWGLWQRRRDFLVLLLWWWLLFMATNPQWFSLPGSGVISNFALFIVVYFPFGLFVGYAAGDLLAWLGARRWGAPLALAAVLGVGLWGATLRLREDVKPELNALVTRPDVRAAAWIQEHTPSEAVFLVNAFPAYSGAAVVGSDGGWWLPLLARRTTTLPPLNYDTERGPTPEYRQWVNAVTRQIEAEGVSSPATLALLREHGVTHLYIGQRQGRVNYGGELSFDPVPLAQDPAWRLVYHQDRVYIFERLP